MLYCKSIEALSVILCLSYLSIEKDIIVTIKTWDASSDITVARSHPMSPNGHGYEFHIIVNSKGITKIIMHNIFSNLLFQSNMIEPVSNVLSSKLFEDLT